MRPTHPKDREGRQLVQVVVETYMTGAGPEEQADGEVQLTQDGWMSEFDAFQSSAKTSGGQTSLLVPGDGHVGRVGSSTSRAYKSSNQVDDDPSYVMDNLQAEMKLLHWHKLANEAALKAALLKTKKIKAGGGKNLRPVPAATALAMPMKERAIWMQQVIEEEQSKPLQVTKECMYKYEAEEKEKDEKLENEVAAHIRSLNKLRKQVSIS